MTVAVDFDNVVREYSSKKQTGPITDPPLPGAIEGLRKLMDMEPVFILTSNDVERVTKWLTDHDFVAIADMGIKRGDRFWNRKGVLLVTNWKLPARAYLDDRAVTFTSWQKALRDLKDGGE